MPVFRGIARVFNESTACRDSIESQQAPARRPILAANPLALVDRGSLIRLARLLYETFQHHFAAGLVEIHGQFDPVDRNDAAGTELEVKDARALGEFRFD